MEAPVSVPRIHCWKQGSAKCSLFGGETAQLSVITAVLIFVLPLRPTGFSKSIWEISQQGNNRERGNGEKHELNKNLRRKLQS